MAALATGGLAGARTGVEAPGPSWVSRWPMESVGTRVRRYRRQRRRSDGTPWTQEDLAEAAGIDRRYLGKIETEEIAEPGIDTLRRIATALGVPLRALAEPMGWYEGEPPGTDDWILRMRGDPTLAEEDKDALERLARRLRDR